MRKFFDKTILTIFSVLILIIGVVINLLAIGWLDWEDASNLIGQVVYNQSLYRVVLIVTEVFMLFAIIAIFTDSDKKEKKAKKDILMQNDNGRLMISRDTIENIVENSIKEFEGVNQKEIRIQLDSESNVIVSVNLTVKEGIIIKDLTVKMQNKIRDTIKKISDLDVKQVNVRIKNMDNPVSVKNEVNE